MAMRTAAPSFSSTQGWLAMAKMRLMRSDVSRCLDTTRRLNFCVIELVVTKPNRRVPPLRAATAALANQCMRTSELSVTNRKRDVEGKRVQVRFENGSSRRIKKKKNKE